MVDIRRFNLLVILGAPPSHFWSPHCETILSQYEPLPETFHLSSPTVSTMSLRCLLPLNPSISNSKLQSIPQIHYFGFKDRLIPAGISQHYLRHFTHRECIKITGIPADHYSGWSKEWQHLLSEQPGLLKQKSIKTDFEKTDKTYALTECSEV